MVTDLCDWEPCEFYGFLYREYSPDDYPDRRWEEVYRPEWTGMKEGSIIVHLSKTEILWERYWCFKKMLRTFCGGNYDHKN